ncbi:hypothetical protein DRE_04482 [Drechslerella stenobrocha 248]|uniref:Transcription initiation factor TFIID subunit 8 n=1 Tax=Drechslerella stenobrocha 248 TaxID=1043628 RepID=W7HQ72_9PEZI|nr:hypothetical protein DRE_04482 [Drechslerella stenobrocha 248]
MAPDIVGFGGPPSKKRRVSPDGEAVSTATPAKRRKLPPIARQIIPPGAAPILSTNVIEPLFEQSIALMLKSCGFEGGSQLAITSIRMRAEQYLHEITNDALKYSTTQRRTRPTVTDFEETLQKTGYSLADLEDEVARYRKSRQQGLITTDDATQALPNGSATLKPKPHIYALPAPDPAPPEQPDLLELLGPELLKPRKRLKLPVPARPAYMALLEQANPDNPRFAASTKPAVSVQTERAYIDPHHPPWPGKHTYERHHEEQQVVRDAKKIRELASEEARQSGETLRKLLAEFSKASSVRKPQGEGANGSGGSSSGSRRGGSEVYRGGNARQARDEMFGKTWEKVLQAMEAEKEQEKAAREEKRRIRRERREREMVSSGANGLFGGSSMMEIDFDGDSTSEDESGEEPGKESQIDEKGLLDTVVNCEKGLWAKGGMKRIMIS